MAGDFIQRSRHGTVFYFRRRIPRHLRLRLGRLHFYASLHTQELAEAKRRARALAALTDRLFMELTYMQGGSDGDGDGIKTFYNVFIDTDPSTGKPRVNATDVKPGEEQSVTSLARLLMGVVNDAPAAPVQLPKPKTPTVAEASAAVLAMPDLKPTTRKEYKRVFDLYAERMGSDTPLGDLPQERFVEFVDYIVSRPNWSSKTKGFYITGAQRLYTFYAARNSAVPKIATAGLKPRRVGPPERRRPFTVDELEVLFANAASYRGDEPAKW